MNLTATDLPILMNAGAVAIGVILLAVGRLLVVLHRVHTQVRAQGEATSASLVVIHELTNSRLSAIEAQLALTKSALAAALTLTEQLKTSQALPSQAPGPNPGESR